MEKVKKLLLFGILTLLGIGSSYAWNYVPNYVDYQHNGSNSSFLIKSWTNSPVISFFAPIDWNFVSPFYRSDQGIYVNSNDIFDVSNYSLSSSFTDTYVGNAKFFYNSNGNRFGAVASRNDGRCDEGGCYLMPLTSTFGGLLYSDLLQGNEYGLYARVFSNDRKCFDSTGMMFNSSQYCDSDFIQIFTHSNYTITSQGNFYDSNANGVDYNKGPVGAGIGMGYSFMFADGNQWVNQNGNYYVDGDVYIRSIFYNGSQTYYLDNVLIYKLNNNTYIDYDSTSNYNVIVLGFGDPITNQYGFNSYPINYSIYSCPYNSTNIRQCSFVEGGTTNEYFNKGFSDGNGYNPWNQVSYFLSKDWSMKLYNQYSSQNNTITFYRYTSSANPTYNDRPTSVSLSLTPNGNDIMSGIPMPDLGGNGNQPFPDSILDGGVFDANTYIIEEGIKCYLTSGEVCSSGISYSGSEIFVNSYDHQPRVRNSVSKTGYLTFNNAVDIMQQYCLNVNTIQYAFCSQLYLYEGYPLTYYYNNGYFNYIVSGSGWEVNLGALWSGQLGYAYCEGPFCSQFNEGLPQFIIKDTGDYSAFGFSGEYVSLDFFKNYFENGFFFQCPFSYSGSYFTIGSKLIDRLDKHDPLKPINCMIAGFSHGVKSKFFGDSKIGLSHSGVLMQNTGPNATRFYTFIDVVLSLGYIFVFSKLFKFLKKH